MEHSPSLEVHSFGKFTMCEPDEPVSKHKYEILKIWVPTHGVVNVYRKPGRTGGTGALEGLLMQCARRPVLIEKSSLYRISC